MMTCWSRQQSSSSQHLSRASRLHARPSENAPLAGLRIGVKDVIDVAGYPTGASNRAFKSFYPVKDISASIVQRLVDLGAVVVGKTKSTQFALGEEPTADWVDEFCPFNLRGDGYHRGKEAVRVAQPRSQRMTGWTSRSEPTVGNPPPGWKTLPNNAHY